MSKRILIVAAVSPDSTRGNRITANRWQRLIRQLGHHVDLAQEYKPGEKYDCLIALHARHSAISIREFRNSSPQAPLIVCLTGTDLHIDFEPANVNASSPEKRANFQAVQQSLDSASRIVLLEPEGQKRLATRYLEKCDVILQSAQAVLDPPKPPDDCFLVTVLGHLRPVKDPFRTAFAARDLPSESRIRVIQLGQALDVEMKEIAEREMQNNSRYQWLGPVSHQQAMRSLAGSHLTVLSSIHEGAPSVISEAIVNRIPILATRIDASIGLLGAQYSGLFAVGDTAGLTELLYRAETEPVFLGQLGTEITRLRPDFSEEREIAAWKSVLISTFAEQ